MSWWVLPSRATPWWWRASCSNAGNPRGRANVAEQCSGGWCWARGWCHQGCQVSPMEKLVGLTTDVIMMYVFSSGCYRQFFLSSDMIVVLCQSDYCLLICGYMWYFRLLIWQTLIQQWGKFRMSWIDGFQNDFWNQPSRYLSEMILTICFCVIIVKHHFWLVLTRWCPPGIANWNYNQGIYQANGRGD